jgi:hypothetical protein
MMRTQKYSPYLLIAVQDLKIRNHKAPPLLWFFNAQKLMKNSKTKIRLAIYKSKLFIVNAFRAILHTE